MWNAPPLKCVLRVSAKLGLHVKIYIYKNLNMILLYDEEKNSLLLIYLSFKKENVNTIFFLSRKLNKRKEFFKLFTEETNQES